MKYRPLLLCLENENDKLLFYCVLHQNDSFKDAFIALTEQSLRELKTDLQSVRLTSKFEMESKFLARNNSAPHNKHQAASSNVPYQQISIDDNCETIFDPQSNILSNNFNHGYLMMDTNATHSIHHEMILIIWFKMDALINLLHEWAVKKIKYKLSIFAASCYVYAANY